jgi:hypothetical protein
MRGYLDRFERQGNAQAGALAGMDYAFENYFSNNSLRIFEAALESSKDDTKLRTVLAEAWYSMYMPNVGKAYRIRMPNEKNSLDDVVLEGGAQHQFVPFETFVQNFYQKFTQGEIDILLRKMLISSEGVLMTQEGRERLHELFMGQVGKKKDDAELRSLIDQLVFSGLSVVDPAKLYQPIADILRERLFVAPKERGSNEGAIRYVYETYTGELRSSLEQKRSRIRGAETTYERAQARERFEEFSQWFEQNNPSLEGTEKLLSFDPLTKTGGIVGSLQAIDAAKQHLVDIVGLPEREHEKRKMQPVEVVMEFSRNMGAVGVRFLQLIGQYIDIPPAYQQRFDESYDKMKGQLKFSAYETLKREATNSDASEEIRDFWDNLESLSPTIAGGSIMTVYEARMKDGGRRIVKVLNPNAEEFIRQNIQDAEQVMQRMESETGNSYELAKVLLEDLRTWLTEDITTTQYGEDDTVFEDINGNTSFATSSGKTVSVSSPKTVHTGTKYVKIEEFIEGQNLSDVLKGRSKARAKDYVETVLASFRHQTENVAEDGFARIHSDVHIGNVRVGTDNKLYWIDRGYYLKMTKEEVDIIDPLLRNEFTPEVGLRAVGYLLNLPENRNNTVQANTSVLFGELATLVNTSRAEGKTTLDTANEVLLTLKRRGVHIPIRFSLFFKNIRAQAKMAGRAGVNLTAPQG